MWICDPLSGSPSHAPSSSSSPIRPFPSSWPKSPNRLGWLILCRGLPPKQVCVDSISLNESQWWICSTRSTALLKSVYGSLSLSHSLFEIPRLDWPSVSPVSRLGTNKRWIQAIPLRFMWPDSGGLMSSLPRVSIGQPLLLCLVTKSTAVGGALRFIKYIDRYWGNKNDWALCCYMSHV